MPIEINIDSLSPIKDLTQGVRSDETLSLFGEEVKVSDPPLDLGAPNSSGVEELTFFVSERVDKEEGERKQKSELRRNAMPMEKIVAYIEAMEGIDGAIQRPNLEALIALMLADETVPPQQHLQNTQLQPTEQHLVLSYALHIADQRELPEAIKKRIENALDALDAQSGGPIHANLNTLEVARAWAKSPQEIAAFQSAYQSIVLDGGSLYATFRLVMEQLKGDTGDKFKQVLDALLKGLGADMRSLRTSVPMARLTTLVMDLYLLHTIQSVFDQSSALLLRLPAQQSQRKPVCDLVNDLVAVADRLLPPSSQIDNLAVTWGVASLVERIIFLTGCHMVFAKIPTKLFRTPEHRGNVLTSSQSALDEAIHAEIQSNRAHDDPPVDGHTNPLRKGR
jgi:type III secretion system YopN/LcrE/InvE/MxiC family regulator